MQIIKTREGGQRGGSCGGVILRIIKHCHYTVKRSNQPVFELEQAFIGLIVLHLGEFIVKIKIFSVVGVGNSTLKGSDLRLGTLLLRLILSKQAACIIKRLLIIVCFSRHTEHV